MPISPPAWWRRLTGRTYPESDALFLAECPHKRSVNLYFSNR
jgi:hypothetical protein